jgi:large subunit ribosomal protein L13
MKNTFIPSSENSQWFVVDAEGQKLGRLSTIVAQVLRGKNKPYYTPYLDMGDYVIIINADKISVSGKKETQKLYRRHSGYPGGLTTETFKALSTRIPERIIEKAVKGMLPKGRLGRHLYTIKGL